MKNGKVFILKTLSDNETNILNFFISKNAEITQSKNSFFNGITEYQIMVKISNFLNIKDINNIISYFDFDDEYINENIDAELYFIDKLELSRRLESLKDKISWLNEELSALNYKY